MLDYRYNDRVRFEPITADSPPTHRAKSVTPSRYVGLCLSSEKLSPFLWQIPYFPNNMKTLPILTLVLSAALTISWAFAADSDPPTAASTPQTAEEKPVQKSVEAAVALLKQSRDRLIDYQPIKATVVEKVAIGNRKFTVSGNYLRGKNLRLRMEFQLQVGGATGSLLEICDGQVLWTRQTIDDRTTLTRRDVGKILEAALDNPRISQNLLVADLGLGGLSGLLASLQRTIAFQSLKDEKIGEHTFQVIEGGWSEGFTAQLLPEGGDTQARLPEYIPDRVRVYFDENLFPRRFLYLKAVPDSGDFRPMVSLSFDDVVLRAPVDNTDFLFTPDDDVEERRDVTNDYLEQLIPAKPSGSNVPSAGSTK
jgi:hypothetical protein